MERLFYTVGDVAEILGENCSAVRYWSNCFDAFLNPQRNGKGDRRFRKEDLETFKRIHYLLKVQRMTIDGAKAALVKEKKSGGLSARVKVLDSLKSMRSQLEEIRSSL